MAGNVVALGNSITLGQGLSAGQDYPSLLGTALGSSFAVTNSGQSGFTTAQLTSNFGSLVQSHFNARAARNILLVNEIGNDLVSGGGGAGVNEATAKANMQALIAMGRFYGWTVLFGTTTPRDAAHFTAGQQTAANNINTFFRSNASESDGIVDFAAATELSDPNSTTYYQDGVHPTAAGAAVLASLACAAIGP